MENNFQSLLQGYLSPDYSIRSTAENQLNALLQKGNPYDLDMIYDALEKATDSQVKLFISLLIKKVFESCLASPNKAQYLEYINLRKGKIVNIVLNINCDLKTLNILIISLCKMIELQINSQNAMTINENIFVSIFLYILEFYNFNKSQPNNYAKTFQALFILFKTMKNLSSITDNIDYDQLFEKYGAYYDQIISDYNNIADNLFVNNNDNASMPFEIMLEYIRLYVKIFTYSIELLKTVQKGQIMNKTFDLLNRMLTFLFSSNNENIQLIKKVFDVVFLCNRILLTYIQHSNNIDVGIIEKYSSLFYIYVSNQQTLERIILMLKHSDNNNNKLTDYKETKFIIHIVDFFKELLQITLFSNWGELVIFKDCYSDNYIQLCDFLNAKFFTVDKVKNLLIFAVRNCLTFKLSEIELAKSDSEEFFMWFDTLSVLYDLREKAGIFCRIIYEKFKKEIKDVYAELENELLNLTQKEMYLLQNGNSLSFEEINLKCALLSMFDNISDMYFSKKRDYQKWLNYILMNQIDINIVNAKGSEIFSKFIIIRLLSKIIDLKEIEQSKNEIFLKIYKIFLDININTYHILLNFACVDFFYAFIDDIMPVEFPNNFLQHYIFKICEMLKCTSSPEIHSKIIKVTGCILKKFKDEDIDQAFPMIFPILTYLWENNWNEYIQSKNSLSTAKTITDHRTKDKLCNEIAIVRQNLIKLTSIFVKRVGFFIKFDNHPNPSIPNITNTNNNNITNNSSASVVNETYFKFIYNIVGYSISVQSQEASLLLSEGFRLILLIQDEFMESSALSTGVKINELKNPLENSSYFPYFLKIYDYLNIILDNLNASSEYFISQLFIIEQYVSLSYINVIGSLLNNCNFVEKIVFILNKLIESKLNKYHQLLFNVMEYLLFIINSFSSISQENKNKYNNFIYNFIQATFSKISSTQIKELINTLINTSEDSIAPLTENETLIIYLGALQLSNRLIYTNMTIYNLNSFEFCEDIASKLLVVYEHKDKSNLNISCIESEVMSNLIFNLDKCFDKTGKVSLITETIKNLVKNRKISEFLNKNDEVLNNILYFFNKMLNSDYYYNLSAHEDKLRLVWSRKFDEINKIDYSDIFFKVKYHMLFLDKMFISEH